MSTKKFLYGIVAIYVVAVVIGIALFHTPGYSKAYMAQYGHEHERYHKIMKSEEYKAYIERPHLYKAMNEDLRAKVAFMDEYKARPAFHAEQRRMFRYGMYFRVLNSAVFVILLGWGLRKPVFAMLDQRITQIRSDLESSAAARKEAEQARAAASAKVDGWKKIEAGLQQQTDADIAQQLEAIHAESKEAQEQLARETADRKQAERYKAARQLKEELVSQTIEALETRYRTEGTQQRLAADVDKFVRLMDRLA